MFVVSRKHVGYTVLFVYTSKLVSILTYSHPLQKFLKASDKTNSGDVGLAEFIHYVREHEKNLRLQFSHLDKNRDGKVDLEELISAFKDLGIDINPNEALSLLNR